MASDYSNLTDAELFELLAEKKFISEKAFAELYGRYSSRVYAYCKRFLGNKESAQDIFQETFAKFYSSANEERVMTNIPAFLLRIARNLCINYKKREKERVSFEDYMENIKVENRQDKNELLSLIKMALDLLPDEFKEVFILREYEGFTYQEIADITDTSVSNVKVRIFRAKKKIRLILAPYLAELKKFS